MTSCEWQGQVKRTEATIPDPGRIMIEFHDLGEGRSVHWQQRSGAAALQAAMADREPGLRRGGDRLARAGVLRWMPEVGGRLDSSIMA